MGETMAEKLLTRHNLAKEAVKAGDILEARIDGAMCHYHASEPMHGLALEMGFKDGLPLQPLAAELVKKRSGALDNPDALCLPQGPLEYHLDPQPREVIHLPRRMLIVFESNYGLRTIYTDGRRLPPQGEPQPYWHGYSVGRWEGDTFVADSNNFRGALTGQPGDGWLDGRGHPFTDALRLTERFRRVNFGRLDIDVTIDDPKAYTRPFTVRVEQEIVADGSEMIEFICHENQMFLKLTGRAPG